MGKKCYLLNKNEFQPILTYCYVFARHMEVCQTNFVIQRFAVYSDIFTIQTILLIFFSFFFFCLTKYHEESYGNLYYVTKISSLKFLSA